MEKSKQNVRSTISEIQQVELDYKAKIAELRKQLKEQSKCVNCKRCAYCVTDWWGGMLICAKPNENVKQRSYDRIGALICTDDLYHKALYCDKYLEDGRQERTVLEIPKEASDFWVKCLKNWFEKSGSNSESLSIETFFNFNERMKNFKKNKED